MKYLSINFYIQGFFSPIIFPFVPKKIRLSYTANKITENCYSNYGKSQFLLKEPSKAGSCVYVNSLKRANVTEIVVESRTLDALPFLKSAECTPSCTQRTLVKIFLIPQYMLQELEKIIVFPCFFQENII